MKREFFTKVAMAALVGASLTIVACGGDEGEATNNVNNVNNLNNTNPDKNLSVVQSDLQRDTNPQIAPGDLATQVSGNTEFALDLYKAVLQDKGDDSLIASPYSVSLALAMTYAGARGQTETDMASVLRYDLPQPDLHTAFNALDLALESRGAGAQGQDDEPFRLRVANSIWGQEGFEFQAPFLDTLAVNYGAGLRVLDFATDPDESRKTINRWVEDKTEERIKDLLPQGSVTPGTRMVLTNAIYFNAAWALKFDENLTREGDFNTLAGAKVRAPMMSQMETFNHVKIDDVDAIELKYDGDEVSMVILVPDDLEALEARIDAQLLADVDAGLAPKLVDLTMPKFEVESTVPLTQTLQDMGMESAFMDADFTGMADASLAITDVFHKAFINLDESGTEAAAATAVVVGETSVPTPDVSLTIDRPFFYLIRDVETKTVIFVGRVVKL